jgi:hypothetical protein
MWSCSLSANRQPSEANRLIQACCRPASVLRGRRSEPDAANPGDCPYHLCAAQSKGRKGEPPLSRCGTQPRTSLRSEPRLCQLWVPGRAVVEPHSHSSIHSRSGGQPHPRHRFRAKPGAHVARLAQPGEDESYGIELIQVLSFCVRE